MKNTVLLIIAIMVLSGHDMYLKLDSYLRNPDTESRIALYNGTFEKSDNVIDRNRMTDVSLLSNGQRVQMDSTQWTEEGMATILNFRTGDPGTYVAGVSTRARNIEMDGETFNEYLEHDGVLDMLEARKKNNTLDQPAVDPAFF